jgi:hypothetical protein
MQPGRHKQRASLGKAVAYFATACFFAAAGFTLSHGTSVASINQTTNQSTNQPTNQPINIGKYA